MKKAEYKEALERANNKIVMLEYDCENYEEEVLEIRNRLKESTYRESTYLEIIQNLSERMK